MTSATSSRRFSVLTHPCRVLACASIIVATSVPTRADEPKARVARSATARSDQAALVTGPGAHLQAQVAGGIGGARIELVPVPARVGVYPPNTVINDQEIVIDSRSTTTRIWLEFKVSGWDPDGNDILDGTGVCTDGVCTAGCLDNSGLGSCIDVCAVNADCDQPTLGLFIAEIIGAGFSDADLDLDGELFDDGIQLAIHPAVIQCPAYNAAANNYCASAFGGLGVSCNTPTFNGACLFDFCCGAMFVSVSDPRPDALWAGVEAIAHADTSSGADNYRLFAYADSPAIFHDDGTKKYAGTLVIDVPPGAAGRYTIPLKPYPYTNLMDSQSLLFDIPLVEASGASIRVRCRSAAQCDDADACTQNQCNVSLGICGFPLVAAFDTLTTCCDSASGEIRVRDDFDDCTDDVCSLPDGRGVPAHSLSPDTTTCVDFLACTLDDHCDGARSQADGGCNGTPIGEFVCKSASDCETLTGTTYSCVGGFCECVELPGTILWDADVLSPVRSSRALTFQVAATATAATSPFTAIEVRLVELHNPSPANEPCCPPQDFSAYESATCTAPGEANGCIRWLGPPVTVLESQDMPAHGSFVASRLQCTPYYHDWTTMGPITAVGAEIMPSSLYEITSYAALCQGAEANCTNVSSPVSVLTRRYGDVVPPFNPPSTLPQASALDIVALLDKYKSLSGSPSKTTAQIQPSVIELNFDVGALDIVAVIHSYQQYAYPYAGPCPCPSLVTCNATPCASPSVCSAGTCVKTCLGGNNATQPCLTDNHCPGGSCPAAGFCRDRCARCSP